MGEEPAPTGKAIHSVLLEPTDLFPFNGLEKGRPVVRQFFLAHHQVGAVKHCADGRDLSHVLLLNLVAHLVPLRVVFNDRHLFDHCVDLGITHTVVLFRVVELLGGSGAIRADEAKARYYNVVLFRAGNFRELRRTASFDLKVNANLLHRLSETTRHAALTGVIAKHGDFIPQLLTTLSVVLAVLRVSGFF